MRNVRARPPCHSQHRRRVTIMRKWTRRAFIGTGTLVGGGLVLGVGGIAFSPSRHSVVGDEGAGAEQLTTWILITPDNIVTVLVPHCEMGQGSQTALAMMVAEEMNADWSLRSEERRVGKECRTRWWEGQ